jgi:Ca2+:H+ antiporter
MATAEVHGLSRPRLSEEWLLPIATLTAMAFYLFGTKLLAGLSNALWFGFVFLWLFSVILGCAFRVVRQADRLAEKLGEPYGTVILTLAITSIEVIAISAVMTHGENNPTLARDTLLSVVMIILNGMVGLSLLIGGWRRPDQAHNMQGANAYLGVIVPLATLGLVLPSFLHGDGTLAFGMSRLVLGIISVVLYGVFLILQSGRHQHFFSEEGSKVGTAVGMSRISIVRPTVLLFAYMVPVVFLVEELATPIDFVVETLHAPAALGGVVMAILVATPEAVSAVRAAIANRLQRAVNISLGSVLSTIAITVPAILLVGHLTGHPVTLGLSGSDLLMLILTLAVSIITFASGRTHVMQGAVHLVLFLAYLLLLLQQ